MVCSKHLKQIKDECLDKCLQYCLKKGLTKSEAMEMANYYKKTGLEFPDELLFVDNFTNKNNISY